MKATKQRSDEATKGLAWITLILVLSGTAMGQTTKPAVMKAGRPIVAIGAGGCVTAACHANVKDYKVIHGPVNVNACEACHKLTSAADHKFEMLRTQAETCTFCHKMDTPTAPVVHKPVLQGQCLQCHDPHGGATNRFLRGKTMNELCSKCHASVVADKKMVHGPVAAGACNSCHQAHSSKYPKLLVAQGRELCLSCHTDMKSQMAKVKFTHKAVEQDCTKCHDPHASNYTMQIKLPPLQLCTSCHEHDKIKTAAMDAKNKHSIVTTGQACLNCHTAHGGDLAKLMRAEPIKVCMKCHEKSQDAGGGRKVASVAEAINPSLSKHGPIRDGNCGGCHNVHGSDVSRLLNKAYPEPFYQPFEIEKYDLCFSCHDKQLVLMETTKGLTGFRDGERNLHFVHVNKSDRGRSCRACHATHASAQPSHVRDSVPYGSWVMPLNFKKTETGGSCMPGCHKQFGYDRVNPAPPALVNPVAPPAAPTTAPSGAVVSEAKESKP